MTTPNGSEAARTFRAASGPVILVLSSALALYLLGDAVARASWGQMLLLAPWVLLVLWGVYELTFVSRVRIDDDGAMVQNLLRRTSFGWSHVRDVDLRWQLEFFLDDGSKISCYGGPTRSRPQRTPSGDDAVKAPAGVRDLTEIRDRWQGAGPAANAPIRRTWDGPALVVLAILVIWAVSSALVVYS
ncbi:PH domain-containing protein [Streptomyces sp. AC495_CC817]|uniref:PH domain-containing protein n=1 Tax=Streptomyces sp. AC495_CC817 TaxID=2823900 RepID=UPI001C27EE51|nr:PH domain-containing protein [Streptomyces sp. AC495_CC817]